MVEQRSSGRFAWRAALGAAFALAAIVSRADELVDLADQAALLVAQLADGDPARRDEAERKLIELAVAATKDSKDAEFLDLLPSLDDGMPQEMRRRLERVIAAVHSRGAAMTLAATNVTLDVTDAPLADVLTEIEKQTGNRVADRREQFGQETAEKRITLAVKDEPFWPTLDAVLDAAAMAPHEFSGDERLPIIEREPGALRRSARAAYRGPFRIDPVSVSAVRGVRAPGQSNLQLMLEVAWEPRLKPLAITQAAADLTATCDDGLVAPPLESQGVFDVEVQSGSHATEVGVALQLPARRATTLTNVSGKFTALVPGKFAELAFDKLAAAQGASQEVDGVTVQVDRVVQHDQLWEVHMRVGADVLADNLASHRSWVFQNTAVLKAAAGEEIAHAGLEMTMQRQREIGFVYLYDLPEGVDIAACQWVYRTPAALALETVEYELKDVPLP